MHVKLFHSDYARIKKDVCKFMTDGYENVIVFSPGEYGEYPIMKLSFVTTWYDGCSKFAWSKNVYHNFYTR